MNSMIREGLAFVQHLAAGAEYRTGVCDDVYSTNSESFPPELLSILYNRSDNEMRPTQGMQC